MHKITSTQHRTYIHTYIPSCGEDWMILAASEVRFSPLAVMGRVLQKRYTTYTTASQARPRSTCMYRWMCECMYRKYPAVRVRLIPMKEPCTPKSTGSVSSEL